MENVNQQGQGYQNDIMETEILEWFLTAPSSISSSSSSSDNEDNLQRNIPKMENFVEEIVPTYSDDTFKQHFRLSRSTAYRLIEQFKNSPYNCRSTNNMGNSAEKAVLLSLWYLANTESFRQIADRFDVATSTSHELLVKVINFILSLREKFIKWPDNDQKRNICTQFRKKHGFKGVIGCIDGSHIKIHRPTKDEEVYVNRKGYHSVLIQGICDYRKLFLDIYCGEPGSIHDARLLRKSSVYRMSEKADTFNNYYLLGDSAYPSLPWLVPPFKDNGALTAEQKQFNYRLSSTRVVIEHAFGLLKGRFRRLGNFENLSVKFIAECIMAACVLHNMCILDNDLMDNVEKDYYDALETLDTDTETPSDPFPTEQLAIDKRAEIFEEMFSV